MNRLLSLCVVPMIGFGLSVAASAASMYEYRIDNLDLDASACASAASEIGARVASVAGVSVIGGACETTDWSRLNMVIRYVAEAPLNLVSTFDRHSLDQGFYASQEQCQQALEAEKAHFAESTGIIPVAWMCRRTISFAYPWATQIDGFGQPLVRPYIFNGHFFAEVNDTSEIAAAVASSIRSEFVDLVGVRVGTREGETTIVIRYYAASRAPVSLQSVANYDSMTACESRREEVFGLFTEMGSRSMSVFCGVAAYASRSQYALVWTSSPWSIEVAGSGYASIAACEEQRGAMVKVFREQLKRDAVGAVCSVERPYLTHGGGIFMKMFVRQ